MTSIPSPFSNQPPSTTNTTAPEARGLVGCPHSGERDLALDVGLAFVGRTTSSSQLQAPAGGGGSASWRARERELLWLEGVMGLLAAVVSVQARAGHIYLFIVVIVAVQGVGLVWFGSDSIYAYKCV